MKGRERVAGGENRDAGEREGGERQPVSGGKHGRWQPPVD